MAKSKILEKVMIGPLGNGVAPERCTTRDTGLEITGTDSGVAVEAIDKYLVKFAKPVLKENRGQLSGSTLCLNCGTTLDGLTGSFRWVIQHGEGICAACRWPCRALHRPSVDGAALFTRPMELILQYHPQHVANTSMMMTLSELIAHVGDENVECQNLDRDIQDIEIRGENATITFRTSRSQCDEFSTERLGLVVWLPREKLPEFQAS